jgi:hypothetical protein
MMADGKKGEIVRVAIGGVLLAGSLLMFATGNETMEALGLALTCIAVLIIGAKRAEHEAHSDQRSTAA